MLSKYEVEAYEKIIKLLKEIKEELKEFNDNETKKES